MGKIQAKLFFCLKATGRFLERQPLKKLTIPRAELMSATLLARLVHAIRSALESRLELSRITYWLDSKTALCWIQNRGEWKQFVRHRVNEILQLSEKTQWRHCPGEYNVADMGSRGVGALQLNESEAWWQGPKWLSQGEHAWPTTENDLGYTSESKVEEKKTTIALVVEARQVPCIANIIKIDNFSSLLKLLRVTAWVRRFIYNCRAQSKNTEGHLTKAEFDDAQNEWIKEAQSNLMKNVDVFEQLKQRFGLVNEQGIYRCVGRLGNSDLNIEARKPILLPRDCKLTEMIVVECHARVHHSGVRATLTELRSRFWVPKGRQTVKKILKHCVTCKRWQGAPYGNPKTADMPNFRATEAIPFSRSGIDFAGPLNVKHPKSRDMHKIYIAVFHVVSQELCT